MLTYISQTFQASFIIKIAMLLRRALRPLLHRFNQVSSHVLHYLRFLTLLPPLPLPPLLLHPLPLPPLSHLQTELFPILERALVLIFHSGQFIYHFLASHFPFLFDF